MWQFVWKLVFLKKGSRMLQILIKKKQGCLFKEYTIPETLVYTPWKINMEPTNHPF